MSKISSVKKLRQSLAEAFQGVGDNTINPSMANAAANLAGKMISTLKLELEHNKMIGSNKEIPFLTDKGEN